MLNVLANHHILPHDGRNMTIDKIYPVFTEVLQLDPTIVRALFAGGISTTGDPNATSFDFHQIGKHGILEHDASLSRADVFWGDAISFNKFIWAQTFSYFTSEIVNIQQAANARLARYLTSKSTNPEFTEDTNGDFAGATALYLSTMGDVETGMAARSWVKSFFGKISQISNL